MSKYTTEVRFICENLSGLEESKGYNDVNNIINMARPKIFDFEYPLFDSEYKPVLESKIIKHFYTREIGLETYGLWKLKLETKLQEIMPYYNKLYDSELLEFNPLYTKDYTRTTKASGVSSQNSASASVSSSTQNETHADKTNDARGKVSTDLYSDTPQGQLTHVEDESYLTNARQIKDNDVGHAETAGNVNTSGNVTGNTIGNVTGNTLDDYIERVIGYDGVCPSDLLDKFRKTFLNIDMLIINELEELFLQLW